MQDQKDLELILRSAVPLVVVETHEEQRVLRLVKTLAERIGRPLYKWAVTLGLQRLDVPREPQLHNSKPVELLAQIKTSRDPGIYVLLDFHPFMDDPVHVRLLKDIALAHEHLGHHLVLVSHRLEIPPELERFCARLQLSMPDRRRIEDIILEEAQRWAQSNPGARVTTHRRTLEMVIENLTGLTASDVRRLARGAIYDDGALTESDLPQITRAKFDLLSRGGVLSFEYETARFADVGGLAGLKRWLDIRREVFAGGKPVPGLDAPKGIMLLGVQGCGKSLAAKAVAGTWGAPLLRMDVGTLYNKFHGETERNLRESLRTATVMAPCVLWVDEIEKAFSTGDNDGGTSRRVLGTLLTWMAENEARVFIVCTANDIESLPPELVRKGRLDEIFFVDLPDADTRRQILSIHLKKRDLDPETFDLEALSLACEGFSGAEVEQAVVAALYSAHAQQARPATEHVEEEIRRTRPLSVVMRERIDHLRAWARERTVPAN